MKIAIAGFGVEGKASLRYFQTAFPDAEFTVADERPVSDIPEGVNVLSGEGVFGSLQDFDMVVRSPSIAPKRIVTNGKLWSATNEFFAKCPATIIGVTGTKGKGTTCSLIASILRAAGKTVHLVGNIGAPALDILHDVQPSDIVVYELSSFQLWDIEQSPPIAVVLMIEPDHLEVHANLEDYIEAKSNIRRYQLGGVCIYHPTSPYAEQIAGTPLVNETVEEWQGQNSLLSNAHKYAVPNDDQAYVEDGFFRIQDRRICSVDTLQIPGTHNIENACAAISAVAELPDWLKTISDEHVAEGLKSFTGLPHRLKFVREIHGVQYYDDSIATTPGSAIAALRSFDQPKIIILGGFDKGAEYSEVVDTVKQTGSKVIAIGQTGEKIYSLCQEKGVVAERVEGGMNEVVPKAVSMATQGDVVILSPASASFDQYKSYASRGEQFVDIVQSLQ